MTDETPSGPKRCAGVTVQGDRCSQVILADGKYCIQHSKNADVIELRDRARVAGGRATSTIAQTMRYLEGDPVRSELLSFLDATMHEVHDGVLAPAVANSIASVSRSMLASITSSEEAVRLTDLESKVERIATAIETAKARRVAR